MFCVGDIESILNHNNEWVFEIGIIYNNNEYYIFDNAYEMFEKIKELKKPIYFHNLDFDFLFFLKNENIEFKNVEIINSGGLIITVLDHENEVYFRNSLTILPMSLKKIVFNFLNINDVEWLQDKNEVLNLDIEEKIKYCEKDCYYLFTALKKFFNIIEEEYKITNFLTIPSLSLKIFKKHFLTSDLKKNIFDVYNRNSFFNENFYFGGHTEKFRTNKLFFENLDYYDVNSLYPYVMSTTRFYQGKLEFIKPNFSTLKNLLKNDEIFFIDCDIFVDCEELRFFPVKDKNDINYYPSGVINVKVSDLSIKYLNDLNKLNNIVKINAILTPLNKNYIYIFKEFVENIYEKRQINLYYSIVMKLILNSLYGKFGQKIGIKRRFINLEKSLQNGYEWLTRVNYNDNIIETYDDELSSFSKAYCRLDLAGIITEKARIYMAMNRKILENNNVEVIYQDTDSLIINNENKIKIENLIKIDNKKIGYFKKENEKLLKGYIIGQKLYYFSEEKKATKGVKKMFAQDFINLSLYIYRERYLNNKFNIEKWVIGKIDLINYPKIKFYNTNFTKLHTLTNKKFFGLNITPFEFNLIRERLDNNIFIKLLDNYDIKNNFLNYDKNNLTKNLEQNIK